MSLTVQDGKLVLRDGALGTGQACCCNKCSGPCGPPVCIYKWYDPEGDPIVACPPGFSIRFDPDTGEEWCDKSGGAVGCAECEANKPNDIPDVQVVCFEENPCPEGCVCVDGQCAAGEQQCFTWEAFNPDDTHNGYYCSLEEANAGAQAQATEEGCAARVLDDPDCTFFSATTNPDCPGCLIEPDTGNPECPEYWLNIVTCCYICVRNPLP